MRIWRTQQPSERQEGQMQSRREDRVTIHLAGLTGCRVHVDFMRSRDISWRHSTNVKESRTEGIRTARPGRSSTLDFASEQV